MSNSSQITRHFDFSLARDHHSDPDPPIRPKEKKTGMEEEGTVVWWKRRVDGARRWKKRHGWLHNDA